METAPTATSPPSMPNHNHSTPDPGNGETWTQILEQLHREISQALTGALPISPKPFHTLSLEELKNLLVTLRFERNINTAQLTGEQRRSLLLRLKICSVWGLSFQAFSDTFGNTVSRDLLDKLLALARQYSFATARPYLLHERQRRRSHTGARRLVEADWLPSDVARAEASLQQAAQAAPRNDVDISAGDELSNLSSGSFFALTINGKSPKLVTRGFANFVAWQMLTGLSSEHHRPSHCRQTQNTAAGPGQRLRPSPRLVLTSHLSILPFSIRCCATRIFLCCPKARPCHFPPRETLLCFRSRGWLLQPQARHPQIAVAK